MQYSGVENVESKVQENDWLDVNYTAKKYLDQPEEKEKKQHHIPSFKGIKKMSTFGKVMVCAVALILALVAFMFVDGNGQTEVFQAVKQTFTTTFSFLGSNSQDVNKNTIAVPYNVTLDSVDKGVVTISGGQALVSFTEGTVSEVTENTVSVTMEDGAVLVYGGCTEIFVKVGDTVSAYDLLARYSETATVSIVVDGQTVLDVVGSENSLQWSV